MLKPTQRTVRKPQRSPSRFLIVASKYNARYVEGMLRGARAVLRQLAQVEVEIIRVPGAFEIPVVAAKAVLGSRRFSAVICLGVILRGQTTHAQFIGESVSLVLAQLQVQSQTPIIHEVLLLENEDQARVRCLDKKHNRGAEAAQTALAMVEVMRRLDAPRSGAVE
jgi:6,7-dimethyl-8-ribityllumazine synthase